MGNERSGNSHATTAQPKQQKAIEIARSIAKNERRSL
ncbi:DUF2188 domain-containing protein [Burkholderia sp. Ax-1719]